MDTTIHTIIAGYGAALVIVAGWCITAIRNAASKRDLEEAIKLVHDRIDGRVDKDVLDQITKHIDSRFDHMEAELRHLREGK